MSISSPEVHQNATGQLVETEEVRPSVDAEAAAIAKLLIAKLNPNEKVVLLAMSDAELNGLITDKISEIEIGPLPPELLTLIRDIVGRDVEIYRERSKQVSLEHDISALAQARRARLASQPIDNSVFDDVIDLDKWREQYKSIVRDIDNAYWDSLQQKSKLMPPSMWPLYQTAVLTKVKSFGVDLPDLGQTLSAQDRYNQLIAAILGAYRKLDLTQNVDKAKAEELKSAVIAISTIPQLRAAKSNAIAYMNSELSRWQEEIRKLPVPIQRLADTILNDTPEQQVRYLLAIGALPAGEIDSARQKIDGFITDTVDEYFLLGAYKNIMPATSKLEIERIQAVRELPKFLTPFNAEMWALFADIQNTGVTPTPETLALAIQGRIEQRNVNGQDISGQNLSDNTELVKQASELLIRLEPTQSSDIPTLLPRHTRKLVEVGEVLSEFTNDHYNIARSFAKAVDFLLEDEQVAKAQAQILIDWFSLNPQRMISVLRNEQRNHLIAVITKLRNRIDKNAPFMILFETYLNQLLS